MLSPKLYCITSIKEKRELKQSEVSQRVPTFFPPTDCEAASLRQYTPGRRGPHLDLKGLRHRCKKNLKERKDKYGNSYARRKLTSNDKLK